jgi:hypothetical protein
MKVCEFCGSKSLFFDAYVGVNDPSDVRVFERIDCDSCGMKDIGVETLEITA